MVLHACREMAFLTGQVDLDGLPSSLLIKPESVIFIKSIPVFLLCVPKNISRLSNKMSVVWSSMQEHKLSFAADLLGTLLSRPTAQAADVELLYGISFLGFGFEVQFRACSRRDSGTETSVQIVVVGDTTELKTLD